MDASIVLQDADWDDSALIQSWDQALQEYNRYHSIHARGERVEDVLAEYELAQLEQEYRVQLGESSGGGEEGLVAEEDGYRTAAEMEMSDSSRDEGEVLSQTSRANQAAPDGEQAAAAAEQSQPPSSNPGVSALSIPLHDENLKNVIMAWYYAGYYTGFHDGQRNAAQASAPPAKKS